HLDGVDPDRIVLWGWSFSGGHVIAVAATDPRIAAVISRAPHVASIPTLMWLPLRNTIRPSVARLLHQVSASRSRPPALVPAVGIPPSSAGTRCRKPRHVRGDDRTGGEAGLRRPAGSEFQVAQ